jgi:hypothetical protein
MRRLLAIVVVIAVVGPAMSAGATELDELLEQNREAAYTAEQAISCSTPDGVRDAVVRISQSGGDITVASSLGDDVEVKTGDGGWTLSSHGGVVSSTAVETDEAEFEDLYRVEDLGETAAMGRSAMSYRLVRDGVIRAELVFDDETGAMVATTTFTENGETYCQHRFISFDPTDPGSDAETTPASEGVTPSQTADTSLPEVISGFQRLDFYEDQLGFRFAYYSDGFFSFAVFETPAIVRLEDAGVYELAGDEYRRAFSPGQATYAWEARSGGMALVGDLPPDLHEEILSALPAPTTPNIFRRLWRSLFG